MKKISLLLLFVLLLAIIPLVSAEADLSVDLQKYEPIPAQPGQYITVYIEVQNIGNDDAVNASLELFNDFPFTVVGDNKIIIGDLKSQNSFVTSVQLKVDSKAVVGSNDLKVGFSPDGTTLWQERSLSIDVKSNDASLSIIDVVPTPSEFSPGLNGTLTISLKNSANVVLRNIGVKIGLVSNSGSSVVDLPFIPSTSSTEKKISRLNPNEVSDITFHLKVYPDAEPGFYKLPLTLNFYDEQGTKTQSQELVGVVIKSIPDLMVYMEKTSITKKSSSGTVTLKFVNKGVSDLKFLDVRLLDSDDYEVVSSNQEYIGDLDSDDYRSETFTIKSNINSFNLNVLVSYKDGNNNDYSSTLSIPFQPFESINDNKKSPSFSTIALIVIILVVAFLWFRKRKHNKNHSKH